MDIGTAGNHHGGNCVSGKSVWDPDACGKIGGVCRRYSRHNLGFDLLSLQDYMDFYAIMIYDITMKYCDGGIE